MPIAAHRCTLAYISGAFGAGNNSTTLISGTTYAIAGTFKNSVFTPGTTPVVKDGGVSIGSAFTANYLAGQVTLNSPPSGAVTIDYNYLATNPAIEVREFSLNLTRDELEATLIGDNDKKYLMGLRGGTGTIGGLDVLSTLFLNFTGPPLIQRSIESIHLDESTFVISVQLNPDARRVFRAFVKIPSLDLSGARDGLVEGSFPFTISEVIAPAESTGKASYAFFTAVP